MFFMLVMLIWVALDGGLAWNLGVSENEDGKLLSNILWYILRKNSENQATLLKKNKRIWKFVLMYRLFYLSFVASLSSDGSHTILIQQVKDLLLDLAHSSFTYDQIYH